jgi:hypothetical protein
MFAIVPNAGIQENIMANVFIFLLIGTPILAVVLFLMLLGRILRSQRQIIDIRAEVGRLREEVERLKRGQQPRPSQVGESH